MLAPIWQPHIGQRAFLEAEARYRVLACGRRWGKTDACAAAILLEILRTSSSKQLILAPTLAQAAILFDRVVEFAEAMFPGEVSTRKSPHPSLRIGDHKVWARSGHVAKTLRGQGATHIVIDEAAFVPAELITDIALPMLATSHGRLTLLSTPFGKNHFWRLFLRGAEGQDEFWSRQAPSWESPYVNSDFLALQQELISERAYAVEYGAEFMDSASQVFATEAIEAASVAELTKVEGPVFVGVDFGRYKDFTAVAVLQGDRNGCNLLDLQKNNKKEWPELLAWLVGIVEQYPGAIVTCDGTSIGDALIAQLIPALPRHSVHSLVFSSKIKRGLVDGLAMLFERRAIHFETNPDLAKELLHFEAVHTRSGHVELSAISGYHDDLVIALSLAAHQLATPYRAHIAALGQRHFHETETLSTQTETFSAPRSEPDRL